jgi:hypothetical protein
MVKAESVAMYSRWHQAGHDTVVRLLLEKGPDITAGFGYYGNVLSESFHGAEAP